MAIILDSIIVTIDSTVIVFVMIFFGVLLTRLKILTIETSNRISKLVINLILPCLLFCDMIKSVTISELENFGIIFIFATFHMFAGSGIGWLLGTLTNANNEIKKLMMCCIGVQETLAFSLVYANVLGESSVVTESHFKNRAVTDVLVYTVFITIYKWIIAYGMLKKEDQDNNIESELLDMTEKNEKILVKREDWIYKIKNIMNPPIYVAIIAIILALIPYMKEYVISGSGSVLKKNVFSAVQDTGAMTTPLICIILGSNLSEGYPPTADIKWIHIWMINLGKLIIMPLIGISMFTLFYTIGFIDRILAIMMIAVYAAPTSKQILIICTNHGNQVENISKIYLIQYMIVALPLSIFNVVSIYILYGSD
ncbi:unnamed protein product [Blepharisma stoltei]|uniref:Auxin efflux carrier n=1 Tax=Blepharisma stoltei TaxID=1481888 RepID=A0AAU9J421_9CILI|nr:unnamed protein product [Blepharisma stoltei]